MIISNQSTKHTIEVPSGLRQGQEFTVPVEIWNLLSPTDKFLFLGRNRLFLMRYGRLKDITLVSVTLCKHNDQTLIKI